MKLMKAHKEDGYLQKITVETSNAIFGFLINPKIDFLKMSSSTIGPKDYIKS